MEYAYQKTKNFERLSFLYLITGNLEKLGKMLKIAEMRSDVMGRFHNALYLGDIQERVKILEDSHHLPLAYVTAKVHGLTEAAEELERQLGEGNLPSLPPQEKSVLLMPPTPILQENNWPLLMVSKGFFEGAFAEPTTGADIDDDGAAGAWGAEMEIVEPEEGVNGDVVIIDDEEKGKAYGILQCLTFHLQFMFVIHLIASLHVTSHLTVSYRFLVWYRELYALQYAYTSQLVYLHSPLAINYS